MSDKIYVDDMPLDKFLAAQAAEIAVLRELVRDLLNLCHYSDKMTDKTIKDITRRAELALGQAAESPEIK